MLKTEPHSTGSTGRPSPRSAPRSHPSTLLRATRELGLGSMLLYLQHQIALRTGWIRLQTPIIAWQDRPLRAWLRDPALAEAETYAAARTASRRFFFGPVADLAPALAAALGDAATSLIEEAEGILEGRFSLFGAAAVPLGFPPDWGAFVPLAGGERAPRPKADRHWSAVRELQMSADIKLLWEPSRFAWAFTLGRAYRLTGDDRYPAAFSTLLDSWRTANRPNAGPHWLSAQEVALRILALTFALHSLGSWLHRNPEQLAHLAATIAVHADRLPATVAYSRSLANNHLISEAAGLYTAGLLFPEMRHAPRWKSLGRGLLIEALPRQFRPDGSHIQYSLNYHRLVLQAGLWCARLAELNDEPFPPAVLDALRRGTAFLASLVDPAAGAAPNFGANDGAQILPLTTCGFGDYRPTLQLSAVTLGTAPPSSGAWGEAAIWFGGLPSHGKASSSTGVLDFPAAGLYRLGNERSWALVRAAHFSSRPGHSDQLHLDLWWHGRNLLCDAGSYLYVSPPPWDNALASAAVHNTLRADGAEPMRRAGPFLWLEWDQGRLIGRWASPGGRLEAVAAEHDGYPRAGVVHRRTVARAGDDLWFVVDDVLGAGRHTATLAWLLPDCEAPRLGAGALLLRWPEVDLSFEVEAPSEGLPAPCSLYREGNRIAGEAIRHAAETWGWRSLTYAYREPALTLAAEIEAALPLRVITWLHLGGPPKEKPRPDWAPPGEGLCAFRSLTYAGEELRIRG